jgi:hypothetical protein
VPQSGQVERSLLSTITVQPGSARSTSTTFMSGAGAKNANAFNPLDAGDRHTVQLEPACTEIEADLSKQQHDTQRRDLPIVDFDWGFRQVRDLPCFTATAVPINILIAECGETQSKVAPLVAL